jgi:hypothetical protein
MFSRTPCGNIAPLLWEYVEGKLPDPAQKARVEAHLNTCARCRAEADTYRKATGALAEYTAQPIPARPPRWGDVHARLTRENTAIPTKNTPMCRRFPLIGVGATGLAAAVAFGVCGILNPLVSDQRAFIASENPNPAFAGAPSSMVRRDKDGVVTINTWVTGSQGISMTADASFINLPVDGVYPVVVKVKNPGKTVEGELLVQPAQQTRGGRRYRQKVTLTGGTTTQVSLYPVVDENNYGSSYLRVSLSGPFRSLEAGVPFPMGGYSGLRVGYIGRGFGVLQPALSPEKLRQQQSDWRNQYHASYAAPENAPERSIGYQNLNMLVLGREAEKLSSQQWKAIRDWVIQGGTLVMPGKSGLNNSEPAYLNTAEGAELAPIQQPWRSQTVGIENLSLLMTTSLYDIPADERKLQATLGTLKPGARGVKGIFPLAKVEAGAETLMARRELGAGSVLYLGFDPTTPTFRDWVGLPTFWANVGKAGRPLVPQEMVRYVAASRANLELVQQKADAADPFRITLPTLRMVLYVFLGYFVLAIPVTFVVLKRMRRMNLAWISGPVLAVFFAGGLYLLTAQLHTAKLSRRTAGVLIATAGDPEARFTGYSELFFPRSGTYDVTVPGAESMELSEIDYISFYKADGQPYYRSGSANTLGPMRALDTLDDGKSVTTPQMNVANLAFRRLHHTQVVNLGGQGITADLTLDRTTGWVTGVVRNNMGRSVQQAEILFPERTNDPFRTDDLVHKISLDNLPVGETKINIRSTRSSLSNVDERIFKEWVRLSARNTGNFGRMMRETIQVPLLVGKTTGQDLGPKLGEWVGSENSVDVLISLNPLNETSNEASVEKGGAK